MIAPDAFISRTWKYLYRYTRLQLGSKKMVTGSIYARLVGPTTGPYRDLQKEHGKL